MLNHRSRFSHLGFILILLLPLFWMMSTSSSALESNQNRVAHSSYQPAPIWFDNISNTAPLAENALPTLTKLAYATLTQSDVAIIIPADLENDEVPRLVFISVSDGVTRAYVNLGGGYGILAALNDVLNNTQVQLPPNYDVRWLKIDIVDAVVDNTSANLSGGFAYDRTLYGLAFSAEIGIAFLPQELTTNTLTDSDNDFRLNNMRDYLLERHDPSKIEALNQLDMQNAIEMYTFTTQSYFADGEKHYPLYRGHRLVTESTSDEWLATSISAGDYLTAVTAENGRFVYAYLPKTDTERASYNALRHAGTLYAMLELYEVTQDADLLAAIQRASGYLVNELIKPCTAYYSGEAVFCVVENNEVKLGGNGLALLALSKYTTVLEDEQYLPIMTGLANWIVGGQSDDGDFVHKILYLTNELTDFRSGYYTGEALFGLMRFYAIDNDSRWLEAADRGARFLILVRDAQVVNSDLPHDHWFLYALNELYRFKNDQIFIDHTLRLVDPILSAQHDASQYPDWAGGYYSPPSSTPAATRAEGLCSAYMLLRDFAPEHASTIRTAILAGLNFQLQTQFQPESLMYLPNPSRAVGGFRRDYGNYEIRIDYNQHNMSAFLCARRIEME